MNEIGIVPLHEISSGQPFGYYARGTHRPEDFVAQVNREYQSDFDPTEVESSYARAVPAPESSEVDMKILFNQKQGRGAFFVTYVLYE